MLDNEPIYDETRLRIFLENSPMTWDKARLIMEQPFDQKLSYFVPFFKYHGDLETAEQRLRGIAKEETLAPDSELRGVFTRTHTHTGPGYTGIEFDPATFRLAYNGVNCITEFLEFCKSEGLDNVLFVNTPWCVDREDNNVAKLVSDAAEIIDSYGYPFLDLQKEIDRIGLDYGRDFYDEQHLNIYGQSKVTEFLGAVLTEEYGVVPREQSLENQKRWENCMIQTREFYLLSDQIAWSGEDTFVTEISYWWNNRYDIIYGVG